MLKTLLDEIISAISENGVKNVFSVFDAVPIADKGEYFTLVGISSFETNSIIRSPYNLYIPFRAGIEITVTAPENSTLSKLYAYYDENILPVICDFSGLSCKVSSLSLKHDSNINRLVLKMNLLTTGIQKTERGSL